MKRATWGALLLLLFVSLFSFTVTAGPLSARSADSPIGGLPTGQTISNGFLTLPFTDSRIVVQQGFMYTWGSQHSGTDYILGERDTGRWQSFDVVAAADGWACGNCTSRQGNAVWIKHVINGITYFTYYGHLDTIDPSIPTGNQQRTVWVQRGQKIGVSGSTGVALGATHLHFQLDDAHSQPIDPYDLRTTREPYAPGCSACQMGAGALWTTNPPSMVSGAPDGAPAPAPPAPPEPVSAQQPPAQRALPPTATATRTPLPTPTEIPCKLDYGKTVQSAVTGAAPEVGYCLSASAGDPISVRMFAALGSNLDTYLKLYDPNGNLVATDDDGAQIGSNSFMVQTVSLTGTYKLVATRYSGTGSYHLRVDKGSESALGDLNGDCMIDGTDIQIMIGYLNARNLAGDLNLDGVVDAQDQQIQVYHLGRGCSMPGR